MVKKTNISSLHLTGESKRFPYSVEHYMKMEGALLAWGSAY